jgi:ferritin-like metal-binding protein YciE
MPFKDPKELFLVMLSNLRHGAERSAKIYEELRDIAQDPDVKEALDARAFVSGKIINSLDECFRLIGEKPVKTAGKLQDALVDEFRKELSEIQSPETKRLFVLATANRLAHLHIADYTTLIAAADLTGHYGVGVLLESCLADKLAFLERTRRLIRERVQQRRAA